MEKNNLLRSSFVLLLFFTFNVSGQQKFAFTHPQMGTVFRVFVYANDSLSATYATEKALQRLDELNLIMSDYREDSELNQLCRTAGTGKFVKVSPDLWNVINESVKAAKLSKGTFDITIGPMTQLWRRMKRQQKLPSPESIEKARSAVGWQNIVLKPDSILLKIPNMRLDLGGIGKGFAEDEMMKVLKKNGIKSAMIEGGGNIVVTSHPDKGWKIRINQKDYFLKNCGISTSGDLYQFVEIDGKKYSHILDPKTGVGMTSSVQISVIAKDGVTSDWASTALCLMPAKEGNSLAKKLIIKVL